MKRAFITGITGQDGYYLAKFLLDKGYEVYGLYRRSSMEIQDRIDDDLKGGVKLVEGDLTDVPSLMKILKEVKPDEVYNLAAQSFVPSSWAQPISTCEITGLGVVRLLEAIRLVNPEIKFYQASTSEMFGKVRETPQNENTPFYPRSPYAFSKVFAYWATINYRESYGIFASNGILFNHESPKRGKQFVTRKITHAVAKIKLGLQDCLELGNLNAQRDWGFAGDYVEAMWEIMQQEKPGEYIIATGEKNSVRDFVEEAFNAVGMHLEWEGEGINEVGKYGEKIVVKVNPEFFRAAEAHFLLGDSTRARQKFGWRPKTSFRELVRIMVEADISALKRKNSEFNY